MARRSFTLQRYETNQVTYRPSSVSASATYYGSYLAYPSSTISASSDTLFTTYSMLEDNDTRLRSDGLLVAPVLNNATKSGSLLPYVSFFEAEIVDYEEIELSWDAPLTDLNLVADVNIVVPTQIIIVYSPDGEPQTISDGSILVSSNNTTSYYHQVPSGKWSYYTLFVKFESRSGEDVYYEPSAKLAVLTPKRYRSVDELYSRIPEYYRLLDGELDQGEGGPLYKFLSIFGYEMDRIKTAIDHLMIMKDPSIANSGVLDYIAQDLGIGVRVHELGASRLRTLINIIGYLRRSEGTISSLEMAVQALTGSDVEVDITSKEVKVYAQRVNLLKDPNIEVVVAGILDAGLASTTSFSDEIEAGATPSATYTSEVSGGTPAVTGGTGLIAAEQKPSWIFEPDPTSGGSVSILQTYAAPPDPPVNPMPRADYIRVKSGDKLYFSMQKNPSSGIQDQIIRVRLMYYNGSDLQVISTSNNPKKISGINYWELEVIEGFTNYVNVFLFVDMPSTINIEEDIGEMLLEREIGGSYFNGYTSLGGWLVDSDTISDYRWYDEAFPDTSIDANRTDAFSVYNSNYSKTRAVVNRMLTSYLPITELTTGTATIYANSTIPNPKWNVTFNHIPGVIRP